MELSGSSLRTLEVIQISRTSRKSVNREMNLQDPLKAGNFFTF
jgi:hypothetical protein